ncbi:MAG: hypothetical protein ACR2FH_07485, partial [Caulobacteraceae bacterium]
MPTLSSADAVVGFARGAFERFAALSPAEIALDAALTAAVLALALGAGAALRRLLKLGLGRLPTGEAAREVKGSAAVRPGWTIAKVALSLAAAWAILRVWGFDPLGWAGGTAGRGLLRVTGRLALLAVVLVAAFELTGLAV